MPFEPLIANCLCRKAPPNLTPFIHAHFRIYDIERYCNIIKWTNNRCDYLLVKANLLMFLELKEKGRSFRPSDLDQLTGCKEIFIRHFRNDRSLRVVFVVVAKKNRFTLASKQRTIESWPVIVTERPSQLIEVLR